MEANGALRAILEARSVAVVGASTGAFGALGSQAELRKVLAATGARVVEGEVPVGRAPSCFDEDGQLTTGTFVDYLQVRGEIRPVRSVVITAPAAGTRAPLRVRFPAPLDHALSAFLEDLRARGLDDRRGFDELGH